MGNNPVNFNDPTGHEACGDGESNDCDASPNTLKIIKKDTSCGGPGQKKCDEVDEVDSPQETVSDLPDIDLASLDFTFDPSQTIVDPFSNPDDQLIYCQTNRCYITQPNIPGEYRFDWSRVDKFGLFLDVTGLGLSIVGLPPVTKFVGINTKVERLTLQSLNVVTTNTGTLNSISTSDGMGLYLTGVGIIIPQLSIPSAAGFVINDLSSGFYFVPDPPRPIQGPQLP